MAGMAGALQFGSVWAAAVGLFLGALFCFILYYVPGMLGQKTGLPLYVVGSSTFGTHGGILMPSLLMGVLQIGWHAVFTFSAASFFFSAIGSDAGPGSGMFWIVCTIWGLALALVGAVGISWLAWISSWLPVFPLLIIIIAGISNVGGLSKFSSSVSITGSGVATVSLLGLAAFTSLQAAAGFFATAGAAGADFAMNSRNKKDVVLGGFFGITVAALVAGIFAMLTIAGAVGKNPAIAVEGGMGTASINVVGVFAGSIGEVGGFIATVMFWVFVIACICPTGFCAFLAANAFSTIFPKLPRIGLTMVAGIIGIVLAATGVAQNLIGFFLIIGASFGPIIGAMTADYLRNGQWSGPRKGINWAGYIAWAVGFVVGILGVIPGIGFGYGLETLMSFIVGLAVYLILADFGLEPEVIPMSSEKA
jgi:cytosine permease